MPELNRESQEGSTEVVCWKDSEVEVTVGKPYKANEVRINVHQRGERLFFAVVDFER